MRMFSYTASLVFPKLVGSIGSCMAILRSGNEPVAYISTIQYFHLNGEKYKIKQTKWMKEYKLNYIVNNLYY